MKKAFAGVAKPGMVKRCACQQPSKMSHLKKQRTPLILNDGHSPLTQINLNKP
jgi:hypothetical protein